MLLLLFSNSYGTFIWSGPVAIRTVIVEPEYRRITIPA
jgi:hypothetical protein